MNRRRSRRYFLGALGAFGVPPLGVPLACAAAAVDTYTMRVSTVAAATSVQTQAVLRFAAAVNRRSKGQLKIEVYPSSQLAKGAEIVSGLVPGVIDLASTAS